VKFVEIVGTALTVEENTIAFLVVLAFASIYPERTTVKYVHLRCVLLALGWCQKMHSYDP
jgi:hypothetical protein